MQKDRLQMGIAIVFSGAMMKVFFAKGRQLLQPDAEIVVQAAFVVVDEHAGRDVHRVAKHQALLNAALADRRFDLRRDVHEGHLRGNVQGQIFGVGLHNAARAGC